MNVQYHPGPQKRKIFVSKSAVGRRRRASVGSRNVREMDMENGLCGIAVGRSGLAYINPFMAWCMASS